MAAGPRWRGGPRPRRVRRGKWGRSPVVLTPYRFAPPRSCDHDTYHHRHLPPGGLLRGRLPHPQHPHGCPEGICKKAVHGTGRLYRPWRSIKKKRRWRGATRRGADHDVAITPTPAPLPIPSSTARHRCIAHRPRCAVAAHRRGCGRHRRRRAAGRGCRPSLPIPSAGGEKKGGGGGQVVLRRRAGISAAASMQLES